MMAFRPIKIVRHYAAISVLVLSCVEPYNTDFGNLADSTLVVEGFLDATARSISVKLSRTQPINDDSPPPTVAGAVVTLTDSGGSKFLLAEEKSGQYATSNINVNFDEKYQLNVATRDGRKFSSDAVAVYRTPLLDSVVYEFTSDGNAIDLMVNTRDATGEAKYFSWEFVETYEYTMPYASQLVYATPPRRRREDEFIFRCWRTIPSYSIGIANTTDLTASVINKKPIIQIPKGSMKLMVRYSILVNQRVVSAEEYEYLRQLKQTTENLGELFGPIPGPVQGNMHEVDQPGTLVLGYFSASEMSRTRKFITSEELPENFRFRHPQCEVFHTCPPPSPQNAPVFCDGPPELADGVNFVLLYPENGGVYAFTSVACGDCTSYGGVTKRPDFW